MIKYLVPVLILGSVGILMGVFFINNETGNETSLNGETSLQLVTTENKILAYKARKVYRPDPDFDPESIMAENISDEAKIVKLNENKQISEDIVSYSYYTDIEVPYEKDEIEKERTPTTKFFDKGNGETEAQIGGAANQAKIGGKWYQINYAKITEKAWNEEVSEEKQISELEPMGALGASPETFPSDATGDGYTWQATWDVSSLIWFGYHCIAAQKIDDTSPTFGTGSQHQFLYGSVYYILITRGFIPFDTTDLPTGITISAATIKVRVTGKGGTTPVIGLVQTTQDDPDDLVLGDHDRCGSCPISPTEGAARISDPTINNYHTFTLNAAGKGWIKYDETNWSKFGIRDSFDIDETSGGQIHDSRYVVMGSGSNATTAYRPLLTVTYTEGSAERRIMNVF